MENTEKPKRIFGYIRVSTNLQKDTSPIAQLNSIKSFIEYKKWDDVPFKHFSDIGMSAKNEKRPQFQEMMKIVGNGDLILIYSLSRLSRNLRSTIDIFNELQNKNVKVSSLTEQLDYSSPIGRFFTNMLSNISQWERENIAQKVSWGMKDMIRKKTLQRRPPYGFKVKRDEYGEIVKGFPFEEVPEEQEVINHICDMYKNKQFTISDIVLKLKDEGIKPRKSKQFYFPVVRDILARKGLITLKD